MGIFRILKSWLAAPTLHIEKRIVKNKSRNELCHCGSQKKYKKCCLNSDAQNEMQENFKIKNAKIQEQFSKQPTRGRVTIANRGLGQASSILEKLKRFKKSVD